MSKQRFVAKKVGDRYELESKRPADDLTRAGWVAGGAVVAVWGAARRSPAGALLAAAGGVMIYHGVTGRNPLRAVVEWIEQRSVGGANQTPSYARDVEAPSTQSPRDEVEEASMESFPASDPPASTASTASPDTP